MIWMNLWLKGLYQRILGARFKKSYLDDTNARTLVLSLIIAGITIVNGISSSIGMLGMMS